jgi:hypothetical protein
LISPMLLWDPSGWWSRIEYIPPSSISFCPFWIFWTRNFCSYMNVFLSCNQWLVWFLYNKVLKSSVVQSTLAVHQEWPALVTLVINSIFPSCRWVVHHNHSTYSSLLYNRRRPFFFFKFRTFWLGHSLHVQFSSNCFENMLVRIALKIPSQWGPSIFDAINK